MMSYKCYLTFASVMISTTLAGNQKQHQELFLAFPKGAAFSVTLAMSTFLPKEVLPAKVPNGYGHIVEYDFLYPFPDRLAINRPPEAPKPLKEKKKKEKEKPQPIIYAPVSPEYFLDFPRSRSSENNFYQNVLDELGKFITSLGHDGAACITRLSCEAQEHVRETSTLLDDIIIALTPTSSKRQCQSSFKDCRFSPLQLIYHSQPIDGI